MKLQVKNFFEIFVILHFLIYLTFSRFVPKDFSQSVPTVQCYANCFQNQKHCIYQEYQTLVYFQSNAASNVHFTLKILVYIIFSLAKQNTEAVLWHNFWKFWQGLGKLEWLKPDWMSWYANINLASKPFLTQFFKCTTKTARFRCLPPINRL